MIKREREKSVMNTRFFYFHIRCVVIFSLMKNRGGEKGVWENTRN